MQYYYGTGGISGNGTPYWWLIDGGNYPASGPGGSGASGGSQTGNGNTGWSSPPCGSDRQMVDGETIYYRLDCDDPDPIDNSALLHEIASAINSQSNAYFNTSNAEKVEYGRIVVKNANNDIYIRNNRTNHRDDDVKIEDNHADNETVIAEEHDHPDSHDQTNELDRPSPDITTYHRK